MRVLIIGGGIGGLATALALHRAGIEVDIYEQAQELRELGVGINVQPHAIKVLAALGLLPDLDESGIRTRELIYANRFGQVVWRELRGADAGYVVDRAFEAAVPWVGRRTQAGVATSKVEPASTAGMSAPGRGLPLPGASVHAALNSRAALATT